MGQHSQQQPDKTLIQNSHYTAESPLAAGCITLFTMDPNPFLRVARSAFYSMGNTDTAYIAFLNSESFLTDPESDFFGS